MGPDRTALPSERGRTGSLVQPKAQHDWHFSRSGRHRDQRLAVRGLTQRRGILGCNSDRSLPFFGNAVSSMINQALSPPTNSTACRHKFAFSDALSRMPAPIKWCSRSLLLREQPWAGCSCDHHHQRPLLVVRPYPPPLNTRNYRHLTHRTVSSTGANTSACTGAVSEYQPITARRPSPEAYTSSASPQYCSGCPLTTKLG